MLVVTCLIKPEMTEIKFPELESAFIEIFDPKKMNIITGCIYKHQILNVNEFNDNYLNELSDKLCKGNRTILFLAI